MCESGVFVQSTVLSKLNMSDEDDTPIAQNIDVVGGPGASSSSSSSSSSESERPSYKRKHDPRIDALISQVGYLSNICMQNLSQGVSYQSNNPSENNSQNKIEDNPSSSFITNPIEIRKVLELGKIETDYNKSKLIKTALPDRVKSIKQLQHFGEPLWKHVKYSKALQTFAATPAFVELKVNDELCHLNKEKDYLAGTEAVIAALSNAVLEQRELLRSGLQNIVDWACQSPQELNPQSLFEKISNNFGNNSDTYKNIEETLQVICGKRAECVEIRRERILKEITNKPIQLALRNIPPSEEHLFEKERLLQLIQSLGGPQTWLSPPACKPESKYPIKRKQGEAGLTGSSHNPKKSKYSSRNQKGNDKFKGKGQGKKSSFRSRQEGNTRDQSK